MKNVLFIAGSVIIFLSSTAYAASPMWPAMQGETGIMRVISAESLPQTGAMFGVDGLYFRDTDLLNTAGDINQRVEGNVNLTYGATDWLELFINESSAAQTIKNSSTGRNDIYQSLGDLTGGLKLSFLASPGFAIGLDAFSQLLTSPDSLGYQWNATSFGARLLWTIDLDALENIPFRLNVNIGYKWDHSRYLLQAPNYTLGQYTSVAQMYSIGIPRSEEEYALGIYHDDQIIGAADLEFPGPYVTPFIQYYTNQIINTGQDSSLPHLRYDQSPQYVTPGFRFTPSRGLAIDAAVDIGITKMESLPSSITPGTKVNVRSVPLWDIVIGASYTILPGETIVIQKVQAPPPPENGKITGVVLDENSGISISGVVIKFEGTDLSNIITDNSGTFTSCPLNPGPVKLDFFKEGYQPVALEGMIVTGQTITQEIAMKKLTLIGAVAGMVTDTTGRPLAAVITFNNTALPPAATDPETGVYFVKMTPGSYEMTVSAQGYVSRTINIQIKNMIKTIVNFTLEPTQAAPPPVPAAEKKPRVILEKAKKKIEITEAIHFEIGRATILEDSYSLLNEIAQVLQDNPDINVRVEGYTDNVGSPSYNLRLSKLRAEHVMKYLIRDGISPDRLTAKGFGMMNPIASNDTAAGRAKNRRVEFTITKE
jgi:outer membrane protein OmpA-like peptidoglycan-associated protein/opacity protein-like surface antigen